MTSPGGWFGGFLDDQIGRKAPSTSPGSSLPRAPSNHTPIPYGQTADSADRQRNPYNQPAPTTSRAGSILYSGLDLPPEWANEAFTFGTGETAVADYYGNPATQTDITRMTVANALAWLRDLSVSNREQYNSWVVKLYDAGYLSESELKFGAYTSVVAQAFAEAAHDTAIVNQSVGTGGSIVTLGDNLSAIAEAATEAGLNGPGGGGSTRVRVDQQVDDTTLRQTLKDTSRNILGRALSDAEEAALVGTFRAVEAQWNQQSWDASLNGGTTTTPPDIADVAEAGINDTLGTERAAQMMGGYVGVLRNITGLGGASMIGETLA